MGVMTRDSLLTEKEPGKFKKMSSYICPMGQIFVYPATTNQSTDANRTTSRSPQNDKDNGRLTKPRENNSASYFKKKGTRMMVRERAASEQSKTIWYGCTVQILHTVCHTVQLCTISSVQNLSKIVTTRIQISCR